MVMPELDARRAQVMAALDPELTRAPTRAAIDRYTGVLYRELDAASMQPGARRRLRRDVLIASGLWGFVAPGDAIPDYRLKMGAKLDGIGRMASWWRPSLTDSLAARVDRAVVWDLLPLEHSAAIDWRSLAPRLRVTVRFRDPSGRTISHWNKLLKGSLVRWLCETGARDPLSLVDFDHPLGYRLDRKESQVGDRDVALVLVQR